MSDPSRTGAARRLATPDAPVRLLLGVLAAALLLAVPAQAAVRHRGRGEGIAATASPSPTRLAPGSRHRGRGDGIPATAPSGAARAGALASLTGLRPSQVRVIDTCPPAAPGHARCAAQALVLRSDGRLVRPRVRGRSSIAPALPRLAGVIRPQAGVPATPPAAGTPAYLQQAYDLTYLSQTAGGSDTVAVVDAYDDPTAESDLAAFRSTYGLPPCTTAGGCFSKVNQNGAASPLPAPDQGWELEISLDLDAVTALCPNCHILLVEADSTSLSDMDQAEVTAAALGASQISDSWSVASGVPIPGTYTFPGAAVIAAAGDSGYNGPGWDAYPAALPGVTAAGGTTLAPSSSTAPSARGFDESAWALSGGWGGGSGCDLGEDKPSWQPDGACTGRAYVDVSADGDPATGLAVYDSGNGGWLLAGGTSLASPLIAAYEAVTGVAGTTPQWAYTDAALLNDISSGSNGSCDASIAYICNAGTGYDGPTGNGSISGDVVAGAPGIGAPSVGPGSGNSYAVSVAAGTANLTAGIYANGLPTTYYWQYGPTTAYGQQSPAASIGAAAGPQAITTELSGLAAGTTYHYRLVAGNADGVSYGYDYTLTTAAGPPQPTAAPAAVGTALQGDALTASAGAWSPTADGYSYQWQRSSDGGATWSPIAGATAAAYTLGAPDAGLLVRVVVSAANQFGSAIAASAAVGPVTAVQPAPPKATGDRGGRRVHRTSSSTASAVLWSGHRAALFARGRRLATADVSVVPVATVASSRRGRARAGAIRTLVVRRAAGVRGELRVRVCEIGGHRRGGTCTRPARLARSLRLRLPAWMRGRVRVIVTPAPPARPARRRR